MLTFVSLSFLFVVSQDKAKLLEGHVLEKKMNPHSEFIPHPAPILECSISGLSGN